MQVLKSARYLKIFNFANIQYLWTISSLTQFCRSQSLKLFNTDFLRNNALFCIKTVLYKKPTWNSESMFPTCLTEIIIKFTLRKQTLIESVLKCLFPRCQEWKFWKTNLKLLRTSLHFVDQPHNRNKMLLLSVKVLSCFALFLFFQFCSTILLVDLMPHAMILMIFWQRENILSPYWVVLDKGNRIFH